MTTTNEYYDKLLKIYQHYPKLTLQNLGYEYFHPNIIKEISDILKIVLGSRFVRFTNFKVYLDAIVIRCQCYYNDTNSFIGVKYINLDSFKYFKL